MPVFDQGRGNFGRTPALTRTDAIVWHDFSLPRRMRLNRSVNVINLFDQDTRTRIFTARYRDQLPVGDAQFFAGFDAQAVAAANRNIRRDPRLQMADQFLGERTVRLQAKLAF